MQKANIIFENTFGFYPIFALTYSWRSRFYVIFSTICSFRRVDSIYVYHYSLAFEPDLSQEHSTNLSFGYPSRQIPMTLSYNLNFSFFDWKLVSLTITKHIHFGEKFGWLVKKIAGLVTYALTFLMIQSKIYWKINWKKRLNICEIHVILSVTEDNIKLVEAKSDKNKWEKEKSEY